MKRNVITFTQNIKRTGQSGGGESYTKIDMNICKMKQTNIRNYSIFGNHRKQLHIYKFSVKRQTVIIAIDAYVS